MAGRYWNLAGHVVDALGRETSLSEALGRARDWGLQAVSAERAGHRSIARLLARDALSLHSAAIGARDWRKAAGWTDPTAVDEAAPSLDDFRPIVAGRAHAPKSIPR